MQGNTVYQQQKQIWTFYYNEKRRFSDKRRLKSDDKITSGSTFIRKVISQNINAPCWKQSFPIYNRIEQKQKGCNYLSDVDTDLFCEKIEMKIVGDEGYDTTENLHEK